MKHYVIMLFMILAGAALNAQAAPEGTPTSNRVLIVVAKAKDLDADHYLWAAEVAVGRLPGGNNEVLKGGLAAAIKEAREKPGTVRGIIEIVVNVYSWDEDVRITCYNPSGRQLWKKKSSVNAGGSEEELARNLFERTLQKAEKMPPCGSGQ